MPSARKPATGTITSRPQASIVCMGGTGTGKTTFVNLVGGSNYRVGHGLASCTDSVQPHKFTLDEYDVTLVDLPGFDDTTKSDSDLLIMIADFLFAEYKKGRRVNGILYFHRISDVRVGGTWKRNFTMFKKLCGEDTFNNVAFVTTQWDQVTKEVADRRLDELKAAPQLFKPVMDGGAEIFKHDYRSEESGRKIIRHLINKAPKALLIQSEMVEGKEVLDTSAGQELQREIMELMEKHRKEMTELLEEIKETRDEAGIGELEEELRALRDKMAHAQAESQKLAGVPNGKTSPGASDFPLNPPLVVATNVGSTSEQPDGFGTKNIVPSEGRRLQKTSGIPTSSRPDLPAGGEIPPTALEKPEEGDKKRLSRGGWFRRLLNFFKRKVHRSPKS